MGQFLQLAVQIDSEYCYLAGTPLQPQVKMVKMGNSCALKGLIGFFGG
jgi:hypothetical protein